MTYFSPNFDSPHFDIRNEFMDALWTTNKKGEKPAAQVSGDARLLLTTLIRRCTTSRPLHATAKNHLDRGDKIDGPNALTTWATMDDLIAATGLSKKRVIKATTESEYEGWLTVIRVHRKSNVYILGWPTFLFHEGAWLTDPGEALERLVARRAQMRWDALKKQDQNPGKSDFLVPKYMMRLVPYMIDSEDRDYYVYRAKVLLGVAPAPNDGALSVATTPNDESLSVATTPNDESLVDSLSVATTPAECPMP